MSRARGRGAQALGLLMLGVVLMAASQSAGDGPGAASVAAQGTKGGQLTRLSVITFSPPLVLVAARLRGYFAAQGLEVEHVITQSSQQLMRGVIDGTYDIGCTNPDNWITYVMRDNADVFMFSGVNTGGERAVVVRPEIQTVEDLRGKALAVDAVDSGLVMILWQILADQGLDFRTGDPRLVPVGTTSLRLESMERGETFGAILTSPETEQALAQGYRVLGRSRDHLPHYPGPQGGTTRAWAAAHEDALVGFIRAYVAATRWALAPEHRDEALALHMAATGATRAQAEDDYAAIQPDAAVNVAGIQTILDLRTALGFMQGPVPPIARLYDTRYWEAATGNRHI
jgi:ABC-type nitrate/sulfonate/bicarbonate transport system substrate-binding protein